MLSSPGCELRVWLASREIYEKLQSSFDYGPVWEVYLVPRSVLLIM